MTAWPSGGAVFALRRDGTTIVRERPVPSSRVTAAQVEARRLMARASAAWRGLSPEDQRAWLLWARRTDPVAGPTGAANAFRSLAVRWLAVNSGDPPSLPPASPFGGDAANLVVEGLAGALRFTADRPNSTGVVTELLALSVRSALSEPRDRDYRALARVAFVSGGLSVEVAARPGRHAVAARFLLRATGQATGVLRLGVVEVG
jgi:hypothetical protein